MKLNSRIITRGKTQGNVIYVTESVNRGQRKKVTFESKSPRFSDTGDYLHNTRTPH